MAVVAPLMKHCVKVERDAQGKKHYYAECENKGCDALIDLYRAAINDSLQCWPCRRVLGYLFGREVREAKIWKLRHRIVSLDEGKDNRRGQYWIRCKTRKCDGVLRLTSHLNKGSEICHRCASNKKRKRPYERSYNRMCKQVPERRKTTVTLTYEEFVKLQKQKQCFYCEKQIPRVVFASEADGTRAVGIYIDRKDSRLPYSKDNSVSCCPSCNFIKGSYLSVDEMRFIMLLRHGHTGRALHLAKSMKPGDHYPTDSHGFIRLLKRLNDPLLGEEPI